jgi:peptide/nickel transport system substrate-binding protein
MTRSDFPQLETTRRGLLLGAAGLGLAAGLGGRAFAQDTPRKGGVLKLGMGGGSTTDVLDIRVLTDWVPLCQAYMLMNGLVEIDRNNQAVPELLESWEAKPGAAEWVFNLRQGVTFHNGKALTVEDVIY